MQGRCLASRIATTAQPRQAPAVIRPGTERSRCRSRGARRPRFRATRRSRRCDPRTDFVFVSNKAGDFRSLYAAKDLHPGLVILVPNVLQEKQGLLFRAALTRLAELGGPVNQLLEVDIVGDEITLRLYDFPAAKS